MGVNYHYTCDICGEQIINEVYTVAVVKSNLIPNTAIDEFNLSKYNKQVMDEVKAQIICKPCYLVWQELLTMRLTKLQEMRERFQKLIKEFKDKQGDINGNQ